MMVHPTYYPGDGWETEDGVRAPTLALLQSRLGCQVEIVGYAPQGYQAPSYPLLSERPSSGLGRILSRKTKDRRVKEIKAQELERQAEVREATRRPAAVVGITRPQGAPRKYNHDTALNLYAQGVDMGLISERVGAPRRTLQAILRVARQAGDERAKRRGGAPVGPRSDWSLARRCRLKRLLDEGRTSGEVARLMGVSRNAVIGKANRLGISVHGGQQFGASTPHAAQAARAGGPSLPAGRPGIRALDALGSAAR